MEINVHSAKRNGFYLRIDRGDRDYVFIHSRYKPIEEAKSWSREWSTQSGNILLIGGGLGYLPKFFRDQETTVYVLEPLGNFQVSEDVPVHNFREKERVFPVELTEDPFTVIEKLPPHFLDRCEIIIHPGYEKLYPEIQKFKQDVKIGIDEQMRGIRTRYNFYWDALDNFLNILPDLEDMYSIRPLEQQYKDIPAIIIGGGPSLDDSLDWLHEFQQNLLLIATDTSLPVLFSASIQPDFVVTLDPQEINAETIQKIPAGPCLVGDWTSQPEYFDWSEERIRFPFYASQEMGGGRPNFPLATVFTPYIGGIQSLQTGGSVSATALDLAQYLGCDPIGITGIDHAYSYHRATCHNTALEKRFIRNSSRFATLANSHLNKIIVQNRVEGKNVPKTTSIQGKQVYTHNEYRAQNKWFEKAGKKMHVTCLDFRAEGLPTRNWQRINQPKEYLRDRPKYNIPRLVKTRMTPLTVNWEELRNKLESTKEKLQKTINSNKEIESLHRDIETLTDPLRNYKKLVGTEPETEMKDFMGRLKEYVTRMINICEDRQ
ncbi:MAG: motility associated factor glycosyltransferase family protein [bacterium]